MAISLKWSVRVPIIKRDILRTKVLIAGHEESVVFHFINEEGMSGKPIDYFPRTLQVQTIDRIVFIPRVSSLYGRGPDFTYTAGNATINWEFEGEGINDLNRGFRKDEGIYTESGIKIELEWSPSSPERSRI